MKDQKDLPMWSKKILSTTECSIIIFSINMQLNYSTQEP